MHRRDLVTATETLLLPLLVLLALGASMQRNAVWRDDRSLAVDAVAKSPFKDRGHYLLGGMAKRDGDLQLAAREFAQAVRFARNRYDRADALNALGHTYELLGMFAQAESAFQDAVRDNPHHSLALNNLGVLQFDRGLVDDAVRSFRRSIANNAGYAKAHYNLGRALAAQGNKAEADASFRRAESLGLDIPRP